MSSVFCSSASASLPCSSSSVPSWRYDVFISFRGEDTRKTFTGHLYSALRREKIETYIDEEDLGRGDEISPALMRAIEESMISVVVFSENYANSSWCLDELVHILECKREYGRQVVPVFYKVDPSDVRHQRGSYETAFAERKKCFEHKLDSWRTALREAADLAGWGLQVTGGNEPKLVELIVEDILKKLNSLSPSCDHEYLKGLFGIEKHIKQIKSSFLKIGTQEDVRILGIWGMGGVGKTTLARVLFNKFSHLFDGRCFLKNVREESEKPNGSRELKLKLFSELLNRKDLNPDSTFERNRLRRKNVFVVLDDVSSVRQLNVLAGDRGDLFGPGSRVIVTTRDKRALIHPVSDVYQLDGLNDDDALRLFHWHAFKETSPTPDFDELSKQLVDYAKGNPLALEISGSFFRGREIEDWKSLLERLKGTSIEDEGSIHKILKISYDGLRKDEKDAFLDIACCFKVWGKDDVERFLDVTIIKDLVDKSLVTIKWEEYIEMHDLVREMGRKVVRESSGGDLGKLSRIWNDEDAYLLLHNNVGTEKIEAIFLNRCQKSCCETQLDLSRDVFKKMYNLRFLRFGSKKVHLPEGLDCLPYKLKYLQWDYYPLKSLPKNSNLCNLVVLHMSESDELEQLCDSVKDLHNLRDIELLFCENLTQLPDLSRASKLESVYLNGCISLKKLPQLPKTMKNFTLCDIDIEEVCSSSFDSLSSLSYLEISECRRLNSFPTKIYLKSLILIDINECPKLKIFPEIEEPMENLTDIYLGRIGIKELPSSIKNLVNLGYLFLEHCEELKLLPNSIWKLYHLKYLRIANCSKLNIFPEIEEPMENLIELKLERIAIKELPRSFENLVNLQELSLRDCEELKLLPNSIWKLYHLKSLCIGNCSKLNIFPEIEEPMKNLTDFNLERIAIKELPRSFENLVNLQKLSLRDCEELKLLPNSIWQLYHLKSLCIFNCSKLNIFPEIEEPMENLLELRLDRTAIKELPGSIENLVNLRELFLNDCKELQHLPNTICKLYHLKEISIFDCSKLQTFPEIEEPMENLMELNLDRIAIKELPRSIENLVNLRGLSLHNCEELKLLPNSIWKLYHLEYLDIINCSKLNIFPEIEEPMENLMYLGLQRTAIKELPRSIENLVYLRTLALSNCEALPNTICKLYHLKYLVIVNCSNALLIFEQHWFDQCIANSWVSIHQYWTWDVKVKMCWTGHKIPRWFSYQNKKSSLTMKL